MFRKILSAVLLLTVLVSVCTVTASAADCFGKESAVKTYVDSDPVTPLESTELYGMTYASVKSFAVIMGAQNIRCDPGAVTVETGTGKIVFTEDSRIVKVNDYRYYIAEGRCTFANNTLMAPLEVLCRAFDAKMVTNEETGEFYLATGAGGGSDFTEDDVKLMAQLVQAEAGNQCMDGKVGVVNVVLNRIDSRYFPTQIRDIIFDTQNGVQFDPVYDGSIYNTPGRDAYTAVYEALEGYNPVGESLFFAATTDCWAAYNRPLITVIEDHYFYG